MKIAFHPDALNYILNFLDVRVWIPTLKKILSNCWCLFKCASRNTFAPLQITSHGIFHRPTLYMICFNILWIWKKIITEVGKQKPYIQQPSQNEKFIRLGLIVSIFLTKCLTFNLINRPLPLSFASLVCLVWNNFLNCELCIV